MGNFDFLRGKKEYEAFAPAAMEAERVYATSPAMCAIGCRKALELAVKWVYAADRTMTLPFKDNLQSLIHEPDFRYAMEYDTWKKLPLIVKLGNLAVHTARNITAADAVVSLRGLFEFIEWIDYCYTDDVRLLGVNNKVLKQYVTSNLHSVMTSVKQQPIVDKVDNPCICASKYTRPSSIQTAQKEKTSGNYLLGVVSTDIKPEFWSTLK